MNLSDYPRVRKALYTVQFVVSGVLLLLGVGYGAAEAGLPEWYGVVSAVAAALWTYLGITAASNTPAEPEPLHRDELGQSALILVLAVVGVVCVVLFLFFALAR